MSTNRQKKRIIEANGKELYKLTVEYLFNIQDKSLKEVKEILREHNLKWVKKCRTFNRALCDPNPHGFRTYIKNKKVINNIRKQLGLNPPALNWFQRLFYFY